MIKLHVFSTWLFLLHSLQFISAFLRITLIKPEFSNICQSIITYSRTPVCIGMTSYNFRPPVLTLNLNQVFLWRQYFTSSATLESQAFSTILCVMSPWDLVGKPLAEVPPLRLRNFPCAPYRPVSNSLELPSFGHFFWVQRKKLIWQVCASAFWYAIALWSHKWLHSTD